MNSPSNSTLLKRNNQAKILSQANDSDGRTFVSKSRQVSSLAFLPILGILIFVICTLLKVYKWSRDNARWKARGDVKFGDEAEVNYGIISAGDKDFCQIDIRSDGASVYDTVNSFRLLENGHAAQLCENYPHHDTLTSYKSLLMQKADGNQYDSVKSYEAFLQKVAQKKDLAVQVKLLESYPAQNSSTEHYGLLEDKGSDRSEAVTVRMFNTLPLKMHLCKDSQLSLFQKEKYKFIGTSGDIPRATTKKPVSASHRVTCPTCSLPSDRCTLPLSGESEQNTQQSYRKNRNSYRKKKKKMHTSSGGRICKGPGSTVHSSLGGYLSKGAVTFQKQRRHFSAHSVRRLKKAANTKSTNSIKCIDCDDSQKSANIKTITNTEAQINLQMVESSSENPDNSHLSDTDFPLDALVSESDNDSKKTISLSDGHVLDVFFSFNSGTVFSSSSEIMQSSPEQSLSETKKIIVYTKEQVFKNELNNAFSLLSSDVMVLGRSASFLGNQNSSVLTGSKDVPIDFISIESQDNHSIFAEGRENMQCATGLSLRSPEAGVYSDSFITTNKQQPSDVLKSGTLECVNSKDRKSEIMCSPQKVQRFHITLVSANISSHNSELNQKLKRKKKLTLPL